MRPVHRIAPAVIRRTIEDPRLAMEVVHKISAPFKNRKHQKRLESYHSLSSPFPTALTKLLGCPEPTINKLISSWAASKVAGSLVEFNAPSEERDIGTAGFLEACYSIVRVTEPSIVLETGVASGFSSATILAALAENRQGKLYSVDLPSFRPESPSLTGQVVPQELRERWQLVLGPDRRVLPDLISKLGPIDAFFYDSDKSYDGMLGTWNLVWDQMRPGGYLMLDDVHVNDAFLDFCEQRGVQPIVVRKPSRRSTQIDTYNFYVGLLQKD